MPDLKHNGIYMAITRSIAVTVAALIISATFAYGHSAMNRFWGEVPVDMLFTGDVLIVKRLTVPRDVTLTIDPGTVVRFEDTGGDNAIIVHGRLVAAGTEESRIRFMPRDDKAGPYRGIIFEGGSGVMNNCDVEGATEGVVDADGRVRLDGVKVTR